MKVLATLGTSTAVVLLFALIGPYAYAQQEIDPDHFDSPTAGPIPHPGLVDSNVAATRYHRTFTLPYSVLCNGKKLAPGRYSISLRSDGKVGQATFHHKGQVVEIADVIQTKALKQGDEVAVVRDNKNGRTLSLVRIRGSDFVLDPKHSANPSGDTIPTRTVTLPLRMIAPNEIANRVLSQARPKP